jgi:hypothetical protein
VINDLQRPLRVTTTGRGNMDQTKSLLDRIAEHDPRSKEFIAPLKSIFSSRKDTEAILSLGGHDARIFMDILDQVS